jgi:hypothetical protein
MAAAVSGAQAQQLVQSPGAFEATYGVSLIGLPIGTAQVKAGLDPSRYRVDISARLTGLAGMVSGGRGAGFSSGSFGGGRVASTGYSASGSNGRESRVVRMAMSGGSATSIDITPPVDKKPDHIPVNDGHRRGVTDPVSALLMPASLADITSGAACNRTIPVFDGNARYDIVLTSAGSRQMQTKSYSGPVAVCNARFVPIAGHRNNRASQFMANNRDMQAWLAPIAGTGLAAPIRIAVRSEIGMVQIEATRFQAPVSAAEATGSTPAAAQTARRN